MSGPEAALAGVRFALIASAVLLWGSAAYLGVLVPRGLAGAVSTRLRGAQRGAVGGLVLAVLAELPINAARIGDGWPDALSPATLSAVLFQTSVGQAWLATSACAILLIAAQGVAGRAGQPAIAVAAGLVLASLSLTGHTAMHGGWRGVLHQTNDAVHVLSGGAWLGALVPFVLILQALDGPRREEAGRALRRFSRAGHVAVALVLASGSLNTALVLGRVPTDLASPYQALLALKITLVALMTALALVNRYALVPRLAREHSSMIRAIRLASWLEVGAGFAVVALVSVFGLLEPA